MMSIQSTLCRVAICLLLVACSKKEDGRPAGKAANLAAVARTAGSPPKILDNAQDNGPERAPPRWAKPMSAPFVARLTGPERVTPGSDVELKLVVERSSGEAPVRVRLALPSGVSLVRGQMEETIPAGESRIERTVVVHVGERMPTASLDVRVDSGGEGFGAHAVRSYRFGRPEPKLPQPGGAGAPVMLNGKSLGQPIKLGR
jgi:hypothetical protein